MDSSDLRIQKTPCREKLKPKALLTMSESISGTIEDSLPSFHSERSRMTHDSESRRDYSELMSSELSKESIQEDLGSTSRSREKAYLSGNKIPKVDSPLYINRMNRVKRLKMKAAESDRRSNRRRKEKYTKAREEKAIERLSWCSSFSREDKDEVEAKPKHAEERERRKDDVPEPAEGGLDAETFCSSDSVPEQQVFNANVVETKATEALDEVELLRKMQQVCKNQFIC